MTSLGQIANFVNGDRSSNYPSGEDFVSDGVPFISAADISEHGISLEKVKRISRASFERLRSGKIRPGDILFCLRGSLGKVGLVDSTYEAAIASSLVIVRPNETTDAQYLYYLLRSPIVQGFVGTLDNGSVQPNLSVREISKIEVPDFGIEEQRAIAHILGTLDDKIELNRKQNETLEAMARALFKAWFVDFEPVRAKMEGRWQRGQSLPGLPAHLYDLFPDRLVESELGEIPEGWTIARAGEIYDVGIGKTPPRKESHWFSKNPKDIPWMSIKDLGNSGVYISEVSEYLTAEAVERFRVRRIPANTVVLSFKLTVGRVAITDSEMLSNEAIAHFIPKEGNKVSAPYLYCYLKQFDYGSLGSTSSIATAVNSDSIRSIPILAPVETIGEAFDVFANKSFAQIRSKQRESHFLSQLRDTLLPKLISGEMRVPDVDKFMEAMA